MTHRIRVDYDPEPIDFGDLPFSDSYEADPDHYVAYGVIVEQQCDLGGWHEVPTPGAAVWGISFLDSDPNRPWPGVYDSPDDLSGHIAEVALDCWSAATMP